VIHGVSHKSFVYKRSHDGFNFFSVLNDVMYKAQAYVEKLLDADEDISSFYLYVL